MFFDSDIVLLDMDGVMADWEAEFAERWRRMHPHLPVLAPEDRSNYLIERDFLIAHGREYLDEVIAVINSPGFFLDMRPIDGAREAVAEMLRLGLRVVVCSSPPDNAHAAGEKRAWLARHFSKDVAMSAILTGDKTVVKGAVLIDDKPEINGAARPEWVHIVYDAPYNRHVTGRLRITWESWLENL